MCETNRTKSQEPNASREMATLFVETLRAALVKQGLPAAGPVATEAEGIIKLMWVAGGRLQVLYVDADEGNARVTSFGRGESKRVAEFTLIAHGEGRQVKEVLKALRAVTS